MELRYYQKEAIEFTMNYMADNAGNPLIVLPTGTGKSVVIADFCRQVLSQWSDTKILIVTHVKELIDQNYKELKALWPEADAGINSAGLNKREYAPSIVFCGIQSVYNKASKFGKVDLILIDEAHLIPRKTNTMYRKFLNALKMVNADMRVIGLTATPYRLDSGLLHSGKDALFDAISYEAPLSEMVEKGYLCRLVSKQPNTRLDVSGVSIRGGEFVPGELEKAVDKDDVNRSAVAEIVALGSDRKAWLLFCAGVKHATHIADIIKGYGITCECVFGDTPRAERERIVADFKAGKIRALVSVGVLTTGFNAPMVDLLGLLRPTQSTGLYVQIMGRAMRTAPNKDNALVLDFAGNVARHGPVDHINPKKPRASDGEGAAPTKTCPECKSIVHAAAKECEECGYIWPERKPEIDHTATTLPVMGAAVAAEWVKVNAVAYRRHRKAGKPDSMTVEYRSGLTVYREWVCFEHKGYPRDKALKWWRQRMTKPGVLPNTVADALFHAHALRKPSEIKVRRNGKYTEVIEFRFVSDLPSGSPRVSVHSASGTNPQKGLLLQHAVHG